MAGEDLSQLLQVCQREGKDSMLLSIRLTGMHLADVGNVLWCRCARGRARTVYNWTAGL